MKPLSLETHESRPLDIVGKTFEAIKEIPGGEEVLTVVGIAARIAIVAFVVTAAAPAIIPRILK